MQNAQTELLPLAPLGGLVEQFRTAFKATDKNKAYEHIIAHPECDAAFIAKLLTETERPQGLLHERDDSWDLDPEPYTPMVGATDATWSHLAEQLFNAMFADPTLTFDQALAVWEHPNYRRHLKGYYRPSPGKLYELFQKLSLAEQFDAIKKHVETHGVEQERRCGTTLLSHMLHWLTIERDTRADHFRRWISLALSRDFHNEQQDKGSFLTVLQGMRQAALAS